MLSYCSKIDDCSLNVQKILDHVSLFVFCKTALAKYLKYTEQKKNLSALLQEDCTTLLDELLHPHEHLLAKKWSLYKNLAAKVAQLEAKQHQQEQVILQLGMQNNTQKSVIESQKNQITSLQGAFDLRISRADSEVKELKDQLLSQSSQAAHQIDSLTKLLSQKEEHELQLSDQLSTFQKELTSFNNTYKATEATLHELQSQIQNLQSTVSERNEEISKQKSEYTFLQSTSSSTIAKLHDEISQLKQEIIQQKQQALSLPPPVPVAPSVPLADLSKMMQQMSAQITNEVTEKLKNQFMNQILNGQASLVHHVKHSEEVMKKEFEVLKKKQLISGGDEHSLLQQQPRGEHNWHHERTELLQKIQQVLNENKKLSTEVSELKSKSVMSGAAFSQPSNNSSNSSGNNENDEIVKLKKQIAEYEKKTQAEAKLWNQKLSKLTNDNKALIEKIDKQLVERRQFTSVIRMHQDAENQFKTQIANLQEEKRLLLEKLNKELGDMKKQMQIEFDRKLTAHLNSANREQSPASASPLSPFKKKM